MPADCEVLREAPGNGYYGYFRTVADIPDAVVLTTVSTGVGTATIASYPYYECTNSCTHGSIQVAVIKLDSPVDPNYPTVQIFQPLLISNYDSADIDLVEFVAEIRPAD